jgi:peptidoglycan/xylan/chitin deacetylase (PgdA/CDA1 family)
MLSWNPRNNQFGKRWVKKSLMTVGALRLAAYTRPVSLIVLMYHSVLDDPRECADSIGLSNIHGTLNFRKQMEVLARNYNPVTIEDIRLFLSEGKKLPRKSVAVTFDDGYADNFEVAAPVLNRLGIPASFYLTVESVETGRLPWFCRLRHAFATTRKESWVDATGRTLALSNAEQREAALMAASEYLTRLVGSAVLGTVGSIERNLGTQPLAPKKRLMMTWQEAKRLRQEGHVIGSHSLTHPNLAHIADDDLNHELTESKRKIENQLAAPVVHFSYPAAALTVSWTERTVRAAERAGYKTAVTTTRGLVSKEANALALHRIGAPDDFDDFQWELEWSSVVLSRS